MTIKIKNGCLICGNIDRHLLKHIETVEKKERVQCAKCEAIFFTEIPTNLPKYDTNYNEHFYRSGDIYKAGIMASKVGWFCKKNLNQPRVLEVGVGNGLTMFLLQQQGIEVDGIELDRAWTQKLYWKLKTQVYADHFEKHAFMHEYDLVYSSHTIEHLTCPHCFMRKCKEILVPDGFLYLDTPDANYWNRQTGRWHHFETRHPFEHICILSEQALHKLAERNGFEVTHFERHLEYDSFQAILRKTPK